MQSIQWKWSVLLIFLLHVGCATITGTSKQTVFVDSDPKGATVTGDHLNRPVVTPTSFNFQKGKPVNLEFSKEGYEPTSMTLNRKIVPSFWLNLLLLDAAFIPMLVDSLTGAMWDYQDSVYVPLNPIHPVAIEDSPRSPEAVFQKPPQPPRQTETSSLSGPRFGIMYLSPASVQKAEAYERRNLSSLITQFGWQFEYRLRKDKPISLVYELIPLVNGIDQNAAFWSAQSLLGVRTQKGLELSVGPYFSHLAGKTSTAVVFNIGWTWEEDGFAVPVNIAVVPRRDYNEGGTDYSLLTGFSW